MKFGEYETVRLLGKGGMSEVHEARHVRLGSRHALKVYAYPKDEDEVRRRFVAEGQMLAQLNHPRVVRVTDFGTDETGRPYFVMDLILAPDGVPKTLADVADGSVDEETIGRWYDDVREGLAYIHAQGIVHRDLKLQNVMIGPDGHAVLTDFGISRLADAKGAAAMAVDPVQTIVRMRDGATPLMGSLGYMAPEVEMGLEATEKSDWYALGVIVYRLLTGTWCDARTDLVGTLETYDPVWLRILPKLLHANPEGRACLSYAVERARDAERREADLEARWLSAKRRGHLARHAARYLAAAVAILFLALGWSWHVGVGLREKLAQPTFADVFCVPAEALADSASRAPQTLSDAWMLTHDLFDDLRDGKVTLEKVRDVLVEMDLRAQQNAFAIFDPNKGVLMTGNARLLQRMLHDAAEEMKRRCP